MPIGKIQRKASDETLASIGMDSTLDSRMSSAEIPQMELLKVNYVHQCKEAMMYNPTELPQMHHARQQHAPLPSAASYKYGASRKSPPTSGNSLHGNVTKVSVGATPKKPPHSSSNSGGAGAGVGRQPLPPPPPTIESWQFLQNAKRAHAAATSKFVVQPRPLEDSDSSCSNGSTGAIDTDTDATVLADCEKSNSWDYRSRVSTCDVRRDIARAGIKSRADRIARIEKSDCEHACESDATATATAKTAQAQQQPRNQSAAAPRPTAVRTPQERRTPPQSKRQAPITPMKEPNMRLRPFSPPSSALASDERYKRASLNAECQQCRCAEDFCGSRAGAACCGRDKGEGARANSLDYRLQHQQQQQQQPQQQHDSRLMSRIPKPINDHGNRASTGSATLFNEVDKQLQWRIKQIREQDGSAHAEQHSFGAPMKPRSRSRDLLDTEHRRSSADGTRLSELNEHKAPRSARPQSANFPKSKVERVHIRKKRQPLLIINQLTPKPEASATSHDRPGESAKSAAAGQARSTTTSCGYKNCNFDNCPVSSQHQDTDDDEETTNNQTRYSLGNCSDSGVSSTSDVKEQTKENNRKNAQKCADCVRQPLAADTKRLSGGEHAYNKHKLSPQASLIFAPDKIKKIEGATGTQIQIQVGKPKNADPNDVQNFAKKNLTKATTDELLTAAMNNTGARAAAIGTRAKQCNIENDLKNNEQRKFNNNNNNSNNNLHKTTTTIRLDDDWVQAPEEAADADYFDAAALRRAPPAAKPAPKPINGNDNCVKIFVRSSANSSRCSSLSANSYLSQTSCSSACSLSPSSLSMSTGSSSCGVSQQDTLSICDSEKDCCCQLDVSYRNSGIFSNQAAVREATQRSPSSPSLSSTGANSEVSCVTCRTVATASGEPATAEKQLSCNAVGGVFWNNAYLFGGEVAALDDNQCCCSLSSCDDDNCSYYEGNCSGIVEIVEHEEEEEEQAHYSASLYALAGSDIGAKGRHRKQRHFLRNSSAEEILIRNKKLLRQTDVIHELRPRSMDGVGADSGVSLNGDTGSSPDSSGEHMQNQQDSEARRLNRGHVLSELLETERIYVTEMSSILKGYCDQMQSEEMMHLVPASLQGKEDILFGNLHELYTFHNDIFLKDLENCISTTELVALCFVQRRDTFYRLYSFYCQNIPRSDRLRETLVDTHLFLQECQKRLGHKLPLAAYLLKPVQRITKYQLLLKDLLRFSDSGSCTKELQKALDCMLIVLKCVNDSMHQVAITGFPTDLAQQGELLLQDSFQIWTEAKKDIRLRIKPQQRHIFLYQKSMLFCKQTSKPGHNKSTYQFKHYLKMSQIGLTESVRGDTKRFEVWLQGRQEVHTLQAPTLEIKHKWVAEIKRVLLNQLEELKGEKIKQYGLNQRGLRQTTSWDTPNIILGTPSRTISCDASSESSNRNSNCSSSGDDNCPTPGTIAVGVGGAVGSTSSGTGCSGSISAISSGGDKDQQEACGWSSDYSNSEDEMSMIEDNSTPRFINFLAQWSNTTNTTTDGGGGGSGADGSYPRSSKSNSKFYVSVEH